MMDCPQFPFDDETVYLFYTEHVFEHITNEAVQNALNEAYRSLVPGGGIRIAVPDIDIAYQAYKTGDIDFFWNLWKNRDYLRRERVIERLFLHYFARHLKYQIAPHEVKRRFREMEKREFLDSIRIQIEGMIECDPSIISRFIGYHINWFDQDKLHEMLENAGFDTVYRSMAQESHFPEMRKESFDTRPEWSLIVEAVK